MIDERSRVDWCPCYQCVRWRVENDPETKAEIALSPINNNPLNRMILCETCGNKRCPHATDHRLACTNSNASGQSGSRYA